jgi:hypothetical protein
LEKYNKYLPILTRNNWLVETDTGYAITKDGVRAFLVWKQSINFHSKIVDSLFSNVRINDDEFIGISESLIKKKYLCKVWNNETYSEGVASTLAGREIFESLEFYLDEKKQKRLLTQQKASRIAKGFMKTLVDVTVAMQKMSAPVKKPTAKRKRTAKKKKRNVTTKQITTKEFEPENMFGKDFERFYKI